MANKIEFCDGSGGVLKRAIGIAVITFAASMLMINTSNATCLDLDFKFERGNKEKNIQAIIDYGKCVKQENKGLAGKYFCYVEKMVGIQRDEDDSKKITSGNIKPRDEKFFVTVDEISDGAKEVQCDYGEYGVANNFGSFYQNSCLANYKIVVSGEDGFSGSSADGFRFRSPLAEFDLRAKNEFVFIQNFFSYYISTGKCEKID